MKSIVIAVVFLAAAVFAGPVKDTPKQSEAVHAAGNNATLSPPVNATTSHHSRSKRDCGVADLDKIQAKITEALEKQIELLLGGHAGNNKTRRSTAEAAAASRVDPDGTVKAVAAAKGSNDSVVPVPEPLFTNGHQLIPPPDASRRVLPAEGGAGGYGSQEGLLPPPPLAPGEEIPPHHDAEPAPAPHPIAGTGNTVQKVVSSANREKGTAVASAIAKRAAVLQTLESSGAKAVSNAEAHKGADSNVQSVLANGTNVGIANALVDNRNASGNSNHTGPELVLQNVVATGSKSVATATNNKGSGSSVQDATALGDEMSIASVVAARAKRGLFYIVEEEEDDGSYKPEPEEERILIRQRVARSPCISTKMDDNLRNLIQDSVATVFADLKKELHL